MINYREDDLIKYPLFKQIISKLNGDEVTDQEVWEEAKISKECPNFEDILLNLSKDRIEALMSDRFRDLDLSLDFYINARDTHISVNDDEIYDISDFVQAVSINGGTF